MLPIDRIKELVGRSNATVLDVGANDGEQTEQFVKAFPLGSVFSFEPEPRAIERFLKRLPSREAQLVRKAVGRRLGIQTFYRSSGKPPHFDEYGKQFGWPSDWDLSGSIRKPLLHLAQHEWCKFDETLDVEVTTLDAWAADQRIRLIDFIWADVQGAEEDLIVGAQTTLRSTRFFYTEYAEQELYEGSANLDQIRALLPDFEVVEVFDNDVLLRNRADWIHRLT